jgi:hypothetical protein
MDIMQTRFDPMVAGLLLATLATGFGQPVITQPPQSCTNVLGATATFTVEATGTDPLAYQWQKINGNWSDLADCIQIRIFPGRSSVAVPHPRPEHGQCPFPGTDRESQAIQPSVRLPGSASSRAS